MHANLPPHLPRLDPATNLKPAAQSSREALQCAAYTPSTFRLTSKPAVPDSPTSAQDPSLSHSPVAFKSLQQQTATVMKQSKLQSVTLAGLKSAADGGGSERKEAPRKRAPLSFISRSELESCSSYMVGRLTQTRINSALEEIARAHSPTTIPYIIRA